ncbi:MAG: T9SS type A sorting domain-containing protein [Saprospiraceae bacterium]|nr:T9SS type A sorting domain-containing protein [Saprospiraceae bacterium]
MKIFNNVTFLFFLFFIQFSSLSAQFNWEHTNGPEGGRFYDMVDDSIYAYVVDGLHMYRTPNGLQWERLPEGNLWPLTASTEKLAGCQYNYFNSGIATRKFVVSYDHGITWIEGAMPPTVYPAFFNIAICTKGIFVSDPNYGYVFRTQDDGLTWDTIVAPELYVRDLFGFGDQLFASAHYKIWRLAANNVDWELISPDFDGGEYLANMYAKDSTLFLATSYYLRTSTDNGLNWKIEPGIKPQDGKFGRVGDRIYKQSSNVQLIYTDDFGQSWEEYSLIDYLPNLTDLASVNGKLLASTSTFGAWVLDENMQNFVPSNKGLTSAQVSDIAVVKKHLWVAAMNGIFNYNTVQQNWEATAEMPTSAFSKLAVSPEGKIAAYGPGYYDIYVSVDSAASWKVIKPSDVHGHIMAIYWLNEKLCARYGYNEFYYTTDLGDTWVPSEPILRVVSFQGKYYGVDHLGFMSVSIDNGASWQLPPMPPVPNCKRLFATEDRLFVVTKHPAWGYQLYSTADGVQWQYSNDGLPQMEWEDMEDLVPYSYVGGIWKANSRYYLHNRGGNFFTSLDSCRTWLPVSRDAHFYIDAVDTIFYGGAYGGGVFKSAPPQNYGALSRGIVYNDLNNNGMRDFGEESLPGVWVSVTKSGSWFFNWVSQTDTSGLYTVGSTPGSEDTLRIAVKSPHILQVNPPYYLVTNAANNRDFGIHFTSNITDVSIQGGLAGRPRPGFKLLTTLKYRNEGTQESSGILSIKLDPIYQFEIADPPPTAILGTDSLVWDFNQFAAFNEKSILLSGNVPSNAALGSPLTIRAHIEPSLTDQQPTNNHWTITDTIVGSFDPNEKRVEPAHGLTAQEIAEGKELLYTIHFQNTGTFQADRVRITDLLDTALNAATLRLVAASHTVTGFQLLPGNLIEIVFDHINLPDSNANEPASHGFVTLAIQRNKAFEPTYIVRNTAAIYFDFNEPIITNTVKTPLYVPETVSTIEPAPGLGFKTLHISPNPASTEFRVFTQGALSGAGQLNLFNTEGKSMQTLQVPDTSVPVNMPVKNIPPGMYFIQVKDVKEQMWGKILIKK